jgi:hypothetical protein
VQKQDWVCLASRSRRVPVVDLAQRGVGVSLLDRGHGVQELNNRPIVKIVPDLWFIFEAQVSLFAVVSILTLARRSGDALSQAGSEKRLASAVGRPSRDHVVSLPKIREHSRE